MTKIEVIDGRLKVEVLGWDKLWACKSRLDIPLANVSGVRLVDDMPRFGSRGIRCPGTHLPGVIIAGSYYRNGQWAFWDVHNVKRVIAVELRNESYTTLYLETEDPEASSGLIRKAISLESGPRHG
jgi:hypothetical protein